MTQPTRNLFTRDDTFFGVCEGLGEDVGVNPIVFRLGFALIMFWSPLWAVVAYAAIGVIVLASRLLFPDRRSAVPVVEEAGRPQLKADRSDNDDAQAPVAKAA